ncbi:hypothetical protein I4U23_023540 [Adineta vaga]|nr:hypothetical protein I4U23_023540 [Adineta vaga]
MSVEINSKTTSVTSAGALFENINCCCSSSVFSILFFAIIIIPTACTAIGITTLVVFGSASKYKIQDFEERVIFQ